MHAMPARSSSGLYWQSFWGTHAFSGGGESAVSRLNINDREKTDVIFLFGVQKYINIDCYRRKSEISSPPKISVFVAATKSPGLAC